MNSNHNYKRFIINCIPHSLSPLAIVAFILQLHLNFYNVFGLRIVESLSSCIEDSKTTFTFIAFKRLY